MKRRVDIRADGRPTAGLAAGALLGFAANSLLCRAALGGAAARIDATSFTGIRLASGALVLWVLVFVADRNRAIGNRKAGSWWSAVALFGYAMAFSLAYLCIPTGVGALALFGAVQLTMIGAGVVRGERPRAAECGARGRGRRSGEGW
jgi:drug/metabolite transporter (DMT)-like permease